MIHISNTQNSIEETLPRDILPFVINTEEQYHKALSIAEKLFFTDNKSDLEGQILDVWCLLIEIYEKKTFQPGENSTLSSILTFLLESKNLTQADLVRAGVGSKSVISEIVNGKRKITKQQAQKLAEFFQISSDLFN